MRADGRRSVLLSVIKNGNASTVDVVNGVKAALKVARGSAPPGMEIKELFDQSVFVSASVDFGIARGAIAAGLTALMIPLFLGSWRSTLVVMISIPLSVLSSLVVLYFLGDTLSTMTLGGLALAIGILVDDSTVTIENTHRLLTEEGQPLPQATLHGSAGIAVPTLVSTLAISCVFTSVVFLEGPAKYLFTPLGLAVVFAMLASYGLSRTLTPITIGLLLKGESHGAEGGWFARFHHNLERGFDRLRDGYAELLATLLTRRIIVPIIAGAILALGTVMYLFVGRDFFPDHRRGADPAACPRSRRHPHRKDRADAGRAAYCRSPMRSAGSTRSMARASRPPPSRPACCRMCWVKRRRNRIRSRSAGGVHGRGRLVLETPWTMSRVPTSLFPGRAANGRKISRKLDNPKPPFSALWSPIRSSVAR